jgi:RHS repeat-associated protein
MAGISSKALSFGTPENRKGFNGNEIQNKEFTDGSGLDVYDFNARTFDQQIGRFLQIDPLFEDQQESLTPYHFSYDNPIRFNDPDGRSPDGCCDLGDLWQDVKDVARQGMLSIGGALNAWSSNQMMGAGRADPNKQSGLTSSDRKAIAIGQVVGDAASIVTGVIEVGLAGGGELVSGGGATPIAVPLAAHGVSSVTMGTTNLLGQYAKVNESKGSESNPHSSSQAARRDAMRKDGVPTSQQPTKQKQTSAGRVLEYEVPKPGGGTTKKQAQQQTKDKDHGPHWEVGSPKKGGQKDPIGRNRLQNDKSKSYYNE